MGLGFFIDARKGTKLDIYRFNKYLSDIRIEIEILKVNPSNRSIEEIEHRHSKISTALSGITDMLLEYVEKSGKHNVILAENAAHDREEIVGHRIRQALLEIGEPAYEKVVKALYSQYHCCLADCIEQPEYLKDILKQLFGSSHRAIVKSISKQLYEFYEQRPIQEFLMAIAK